MAHDDEGLLRQRLQPEVTCPTRQSQQLVEIAEVRGPLHVFRVRMNEAWILAQFSP